MFDQLKKYKSNNHFFFDGRSELENVCNAPKNANGVYLVYALKNGRVELVYIGSSGKIKQNGKIGKSKGGMFDKIVNGEPFGKPRIKSWKQKLLVEKIDALDIYWYETFIKNHNDIPLYVKGSIIQIYFYINENLPEWNKEF